MEKETNHNIRLGIFVIAGTLILLAALYFIGNNRDLFGNTFTIYASFHDVNGLQEGNNVRYAGIDVGTVTKIEIINDTTVRVEMKIESKLKDRIHLNSLTSVGTDGLMGNKLINIEQGSAESPLVEEGSSLSSMAGVDTEAMLRKLDFTNDNVATISANLKDITEKINTGKGTLYTVLMDTGLASSLRNTLSNIQMISQNLNETSEHLSILTSDVKNGKGLLGKLVTDTAMANNLQLTLSQIKQSSDQINGAAENLNSITKKIIGKSNKFLSKLFVCACKN